MSFISDTWNKITDAGKGIIDRFRGTGTEQPVQPGAQPANNTPPPASEQKEVASGVLPGHKVDVEAFSHKHEITHALDLLRLEKCDEVLERAKRANAKMKEAHGKSTAIVHLQEHITARTDKNGQFHVKDEETKDLIRKAKEAGAVIDEKITIYTKEMREELLHNVERRSKQIDFETNQHHSEAKECVELHTNLFNILKSIWDRLFELGRKFIQGMQPR